MTSKTMDPQADLYRHSAVATVIGYVSSTMVAIWLALPPWAQTLAQFCVTLFFGLVTLTISHFYRRFLHHYFPEKMQAKEKAKSAGAGQD